MKNIISYISVICLCFFSTANAAVFCCDSIKVLGEAHVNTEIEIQTETVSKGTPPCHGDTIESSSQDITKNKAVDEQSCCDCVDCTQISSLIDDESSLSTNIKILYQLSSKTFPAPYLKHLYDPPIINS